MCRIVGEKPLILIMSTGCTFRLEAEQGRNAAERKIRWDSGTSNNECSKTLGRKSKWVLEMEQIVPWDSLGADLEIVAVGDEGRVFAAPAGGAGGFGVDADAGEHAFEREVAERIGFDEVANGLDVGLVPRKPITHVWATDTRSGTKAGGDQVGFTGRIDTVIARMHGRRT